MKARVCCWVLVPVLVGVLTYFVATGQLHRARSAALTADPVLDCPAELDLGDREIGDKALARFSIANKGGGELVVDEIQTDCSCAGMEVEKEINRYERVQALRLKPGERADLVLRISVRGVPVGARMVNVVTFRTNDPSHPEARIEAFVRRVSGGVFCSPESVVVGTVPVGAVVRHVIDVRDKALKPRVIARVASTRPDRVSVRLLLAGPLAKETPEHPDGSLIGRIEVIVRTATPGEVNATIEVQPDGEKRRPDAVTVVGRVAPPVEMAPTLLVLPRASAGGPLYHATCVVRSNNGKPLSITVDPTPPGLTVEVLDQTDPTLQTVRLVWNPAENKASGEVVRERVRFQARAGDDKVTLERPLLLRRGK